MEALSSNFRKIQRELNKLVLNRLDADESLYKYDLEMLRHLFVCNIMSAWGKGGKLRIIGAAEAISNMLIGFEELDIDKILVDLDHPEFRNRSSLALNLQNYATGMYYIASSSLYRISKEDLKSWSLKALKGNETMLDLIEKLWNITELRRFEKKRGYNMINNIIGAVFGIFNAMMKYLLILYPRLIYLEKKHFEEIGFIDLENSQSFLRSLEVLHQRSQKYITNVLELERNQFFDPNDNPLNSMIIKANIEYIKLRGTILSGLSFINSIIKDEHTYDSNLMDKITNQFKSTLRNIFSIFSNTNILSNRFGEVSEEYLHYLLEFLAFNSIQENDIDILEEIREFSEDYFKNEGIEKFPRLYYKYLLFTSTLALKKHEKNRLVEISENLLKNLDFLKLQPRDEFSFALLAYLLKLVTKQINADGFLVRINEAKENVKNYNTEEYNDEIDSYIQNLSLALIGKKPDYSFQRINNPIVFDPYSYIIPDFSNYSTQEEFENLIYLPFNLEIDYLE
ncbi:MAG: hypothetical protein GF311_20905 [Candidatus Lokiarchaeota archaeon]|nr:hypothetical protein [Candidatus Lokiarchaeota archaeon]